MTWLGAWSRYNANLWRWDLSKRRTAPLGREAAPRNICHRSPSDRKQRAAAQPSGDKSPRHKGIQICLLSEGKWQHRTDRLPLRQALLKLHRVVNQHVLPGKRFGGDQPRQPKPHAGHAQHRRP